MHANLLSASIILAWLVTPESLRFVNLGTGLAGIYYIIALSFGAALAMLCAHQIYKPAIYTAKSVSDYNILRKVIGKTASLSLIVSGRIPLFLFASTGLLVTAGFAFNEIFLYWFPNFLFASILLMCIALLNALGKSLAMKFQVVFIAITLLSLILLIIMGWEKGIITNINFAGADNGLSFTLFALGFVSFLGFDLYKPGNKPKIVFFAVTLGLIVLTLWSFTAMNHLPPDRLAQSSIANILVAKAVAGELGRYVMGLVIIFGVASGVNGLFINVQSTFSELAKERILPHIFQSKWVLAIIFGIFIEAMMMTGVAGEEILETKVYASILLWLLYLGIRVGATAFYHYKSDFRKGGLGYVAGFTVLFLMTILALKGLEAIYIFKYFIMVLMGTFLLSFMLTKMYKKFSLNI